MKDMLDEDFASLASTSEEALRWVMSLGVRTRNTRFDKYLKRIKEIENNSVNGTMAQLDDKSDIYFDALYEFSDLSYAHQTFFGKEPDGLTDLLSKLVKGPELTRMENENNSTARNFSFETVLGARLAGSGFNISFTMSGDIYAGPVPFPVYIQCKRPRSLSSLNRRMVEASKQLQKDLENEENKLAIGIIAIDATHLINPDLTMLISPTRALSDSWHMKILNEFCTNHIKPVMQDADITRHPGIVGVMVRFAGQWGIQNTRTIHYHHDLLSMHLPNLKPDKFNQALYFQAMMQRQLE